MDHINKYFGRVFRATRKIDRYDTHGTGLGHGEMRTLRFIALHPGTTQQDISNRFEINKAATARQCASLEEKGFITRTGNEKDGRSKLLFPTEKAKKIREEHHMGEEQAFDEVLTVLTDEEKAELTRLLKKIADSLPDHEGGRK